MIIHWSIQFIFTSKQSSNAKNKRCLGTTVLLSWMLANTVSVVQLKILLNHTGWLTLFNTKHNTDLTMWFACFFIRLALCLLTDISVNNLVWICFRLHLKYKQLEIRKSDNLQRITKKKKKIYNQGLKLKYSDEYYIIQYGWDPRNGPEPRYQVLLMSSKLRLANHLCRSHMCSSPRDTTGWAAATIPTALWSQLPAPTHWGLSARRQRHPSPEHEKNSLLGSDGQWQMDTFMHFSVHR